MEVLKKVAEKLFGNEFQCKVYSNGITFASNDNSRAFSFGLISSSGTFRLREKIHAIKRFEEVETILQPVLTKLKIGQGDFEQNVYGVDFKGTIRKAVPIQGLAGVDASFIENMTYIDTENEAQILPVLTELKKATLVLENEFINKYQTLQQVYDAVQEMTPKERGEFISMPGPIRNLVIEALCNPSADLDTKFERTIADSKDAEKRHPDVFKNYDKAASELQKYFKSRKA